MPDLRLPDGMPTYLPDAERWLAGACLLSEPEELAGLSGHVGPRDFWLYDCALVFGTCMELTKTGQVPTVIAVAHWLDGKRRLDRAGGVPYLVRLAGEMMAAVYRSAGAMAGLGDFIHHYAERRRIQQTATAAVKAAHDGDVDGAREILQREQPAHWADDERYTEAT